MGRFRFKLMKYTIFVYFDLRLLSTNSPEATATIAITIMTA